MLLSELQTPCLVLDRRKLERNIGRMRDHVTRLGVPLRPHAKTAKSIDVLRLALEGHPGGITVSTLKEAEYFFGNGITDILYAVGIAPGKWERVASLRKKGADITIVLDTIEQAKIAAAKSSELRVPFPALIEVDSDGHRSGVQPGDPTLLEIGSMLHQEEGTELKGVMTHAGASYNAASTDGIRAVAVQERNAAVACVETLRRAGLPCPVVSVGSTPTVTFSEDLAGVTEVRAGVYMFYDLVMAGLGVCDRDDIALSALASVIGYQKRTGWIITDAGWMALSRDRSTANQRVDQGYGMVCDVDGLPIDDLIVTATNQEHGIIARRREGLPDFDRFPIGTPLRILPNHACATAAMHDRYYVVNGSPEVMDIWPRCHGW